MVSVQRSKMLASAGNLTSTASLPCEWRKGREEEEEEWERGGGGGRRREEKREESRGQEKWTEDGIEGMKGRKGENGKEESEQRK